MSDSTPQSARTLRINWVLPRATLSGGIKSNRLIAEAMARRGHVVTMAYLDVPRPWPSWRQPLRVLRRLRRRLGAPAPDGHHLERSAVRLVPLRGARIECEDLPDADVTIATWWETVEWISGWPASKGIKAHFIRAHEIYNGDEDRIRATYRSGALKLVISRWLQRLMAEEYGDPTAVLVPNGVDRAQFGSTERGKAAVPTVGMLYSTAPWKGSATAFEAIRAVQRRVPELRVIAFGSRPIARGHEPPNHFEFHLRPEQSVIPGLYRRCDCWIVSSTTEGFGMPGLEAAACRCPIVSTKCGGPEDYVTDGASGFLVDVGDASGMARRIGDIIALDDAAWRRMSEASFAIARRFDWDRSAEILDRALMDAVDAAARRKAG